MSKIEEETKLQLKNKDDEIKSLHDKMVNLNQTIESLQLKLDKEIAERQRLGQELSTMNNECKVWASEKSAFERQVIYLIKENFIIVLLKINN